MISIVAAIGRNRELGNGNELLWHIPEDLKRFKALTSGHPVIMGRKTFESIGRPLPNRTNIIITRDTKWKADGVHTAHSLEDAIGLAALMPGAEETFVIGGAQIYEAALPRVDRVYLTLIDDSKPADAFFPEYEKEFTKKITEESHEWNGLTYSWVDLER